MYKKKMKENERKGKEKLVFLIYKWTSSKSKQFWSKVKLALPNKILSIFKGLNCLVTRNNDYIKSEKQ